MRTVAAAGGVLAFALAACGAAPDSGADGSSAALTSTKAKRTIPAEVDAILDSLEFTHYQHDSVIDAAAGRYDTDCSGLVDFVLQTVDDAAYDELQAATTSRALAASYVTFIGELRSSTSDSTSSRATKAKHWKRVTDVHDLVPGDIIAWTTPASVESDDTGHVMIVEAIPVVAGAVGAASAQVSIVDSTNDGHGDADPRTPDGHNGVGRGVIVLEVQADGSPSAYRWSTDTDSPRYSTTIVMAHVEVSSTD